MIKIFHTGDLHLDSAFCRLSHADRIAARAHQRDIFLKMMKYVSQEAFDLVLISGDLFDGRNITPETEECVINTFASLSCPVVIAPGNHDPFALTEIYSASKLPENVYVFNSTEMQVISFEELRVQVCGYAFVESNTLDVNALDSFEPPVFDGVTLLCAHAELDVPSSKTAPISSSDIADRRFAYAALGHIHRYGMTRKGDSLIAYCGAPEGRAFDEIGEGGAIELTVSDGKVSAERVIFSERRFLLDSFDANGANDCKELTERICEFVKSRGYGKDTALRLTLTGEVAMGLSLDKSAIETALGDLLMLAELEDETYPAIDLHALEGDFTLRGEVYRVLRPRLESENKDERRLAAEALKAALLAIDGRDIK